MDRTDQETQFYERIGRAGRMRIGAVVGVVLVIAFGVAVAIAASPEPSDGSGSPAVPSTSQAPASTEPTATSTPAATTAPAAPTAPAATTAPGASTAPDDRRTFGHFGWGPGFGGRGSGSVFGPITVSSIDGSSVSLKTADGWTRTVTVNDSVKVTKGGADTTLGDLKVGDQVRLGQTKATDGTYTVTSVDIVLPIAFGEVTAKTSDSITVKRPDGTTTTIHVGTGTTYRVGGVDNATLADVAVGSFVVAQGTERSDGSLDAVSVGSGFGHRMFPGGRDPSGPAWPDGKDPNGAPDASPGATTTPG